MGVCDSYIKEHDIEGNSISIPTSALKIISDLSNRCICKIRLNEKGTGTGCFCAIPFPDKYNRLPVLITNNHVLESEDIVEGKIIKFSINNEKHKYEIKIDDKRKRYTNEKYDITFIEIKKEIDNLNINSFLDIDEDIFEENYEKIYDKKHVYLLHYPHGNLSEYSSGIMKGFLLDKNYTFKHTCKTENGSSGGPIINLLNHKVIGIHKGYKENQKFNLGTILKEPINDFYFKREEIFENYFNYSCNLSGDKDMEYYSLLDTFVKLKSDLKTFLKEQSYILSKPLLNIYENKKEIKGDFRGSFLDSLSFNVDVLFLENIFNFIYLYKTDKIYELLNNANMNYKDENFEFEIYYWDEFRRLDFIRLYESLAINKIPQIKSAIKYHNYGIISLKELNDIEYNINLINSNFTGENIKVLNEFYNRVMELFSLRRKLDENNN